MAPCQLKAIGITNTDRTGCEYFTCLHVGDLVRYEQFSVFKLIGIVCLEVWWSFCSNDVCYASPVTTIRNDH